MRRTYRLGVTLVSLAICIGGGFTAAKMVRTHSPASVLASVPASTSATVSHPAAWTGILQNNGGKVSVPSSNGDNASTVVSAAMGSAQPMAKAEPAKQTGESVSTSQNPNSSLSPTLPPGVVYDSSVHPLVDLSSSLQVKQRAILEIAKEKLGTPYIWGHNEDRGQYGFDCSNYVAYVFHHALGYKFSGASQIQFKTLGQPVSLSNIQIGDVIFFEQGAHEGIYVGNGRMIQEGGGIGKVGYLSVKPDSYWGKRISSVVSLV